MSEEWRVYRVTFPVDMETDNPRMASMEVSAHPLRSRILVKHQVWLLLSQKGYDVDPTSGTIEHIGYETNTEDK